MFFLVLKTISCPLLPPHPPPPSHSLSLSPTHSLSHTTARHIRPRVQHMHMQTHARARWNFERTPLACGVRTLVHTDRGAWCITVATPLLFLLREHVGGEGQMKECMREGQGGGWHARQPFGVLSFLSGEGEVGRFVGGCVWAWGWWWWGGVGGSGVRFICCRRKTLTPEL